MKPVMTGLSRPSTSKSGIGSRKKDVEARDNPGHDGEVILGGTQFNDGNAA
jgi:hypothetical protein